MMTRIDYYEQTDMVRIILNDKDVGKAELLLQNEWQGTGRIYTKRWDPVLIGFLIDNFPRAYYCVSFGEKCKVIEINGDSSDIIDDVLFKTSAKGKWHTTYEK